MVMTSVNSSELGYVCDLDLSDFSGGNCLQQGWGTSGFRPYKVHEIIWSGPFKAATDRTKNSTNQGAFFKIAT